MTYDGYSDAKYDRIVENPPENLRPQVGEKYDANLSGHIS